MDGVGIDVFVQRVEEETLVKNSSACKDYLIEAMKYHLLPAEQRSMMKTVRTRVRTPVSYPKVCVFFIILAQRFLKGHNSF